MPLYVILRTLNEKYLLETFLRHYQALGADHIYLFDCGSKDGTVDIVEKWESETNLVHLVLTDPKYQHSGYQQQTAFCNFILDWVIRQSIHSSEDNWWIFPDADEFMWLDSSQHFSHFLDQYAQFPVIRAIFFDWYLSPDHFHANLTPEQILELISKRALKGKISDLWGDPFYKDYILHVSDETLPLITRFRTVAGFHRFIHNNKVFFPPNEPNVFVDHIRILPQKIFQNRIIKRLQLLEDNRDDWSFVHFNRLNSLIQNYDQKYLHLKLQSFNELKEEVGRLGSYDNSQSYYNNVIMQENIRFPSGSRPSIHDKEK
ncbi:MAG: glycosyltransferase family 2 protein [Candidatus Hodarchaeales archaeon]|jgi:glycosyltransferase involved in cell wall biosynthesis